MRIIAGRFKGINLPKPKNDSTRPTTDRTREAVFSALGDEIAASQVLDLFAGVGSVGLEALSRGAGHVTFVERNRRAARLIKELAGRLDIVDCCEVLEMDWGRGLDILRTRGSKFDLAYLDPPYGSGLLGQALSSEVLITIVKPRGLIITESRLKTRDQSNAPEQCSNIFSRNYGDTLIEMFRKNTD
jgi:16S rRNA (guanine(966)-N(2))-methyltransferase RsmD